MHALVRRAASLAISLLTPLDLSLACFLPPPPRRPHNPPPLPPPFRSAQVVGIMQREGVDPDVITFNSLIKAAGRAGRMSDALAAAAELRAAGLRPTAVTYASLLHAAARTRHGDAEWMLQVGPAGRAFVSMFVGAGICRSQGQRLGRRAVGATGRVACSTALPQGPRRDASATILLPTCSSYRPATADGSRPSRTGRPCLPPPSGAPPVWLPATPSHAMSPCPRPPQLFDEMVGAGVKPNDYVVSALFSAASHVACTPAQQDRLLAALALLRRWACKSRAGGNVRRRPKRIAA
jgi:pentatricopeptide repeat protein